MLRVIRMTALSGALAFQSCTSLVMRVSSFWVSIGPGRMLSPLTFSRQRQLWIRRVS